MGESSAGAKEPAEARPAGQVSQSGLPEVGEGMQWVVAEWGTPGKSRPETGPFRVCIPGMKEDPAGRSRLLLVEDGAGSVVLSQCPAGRHRPHSAWCLGVPLQPGLVRGQLAPRAVARVHESPAKSLIKGPHWKSVLES